MMNIMLLTVCLIALKLLNKIEELEEKTRFEDWSDVVLERTV